MSYGEVFIWLLVVVRPRWRWWMEASRRWSCASWWLCHPASVKDGQWLTHAASRRLRPRLKSIMKLRVQICGISIDVVLAVVVCVGSFLCVCIHDHHSDHTYVVASLAQVHSKSYHSQAFFGCEWHDFESNVTLRTPFCGWGLVRPWGLRVGNGFGLKERCLGFTVFLRFSWTFPSWCY